MLILEIKEPRERNVEIAGYDPPFTWRLAARSPDRKMLEEFAAKLPLEMFYHGEREYRIVKEA